MQSPRPLQAPCGPAFKDTAVLALAFAGTESPPAGDFAPEPAAQDTPVPQELPAAIFPQEEAGSQPAVFVADTAFDADDDDGDWPSPEE